MVQRKIFINVISECNVSLLLLRMGFNYISSDAKLLHQNTIFVSKKLDELDIENILVDIDRASEYYERGYNVFVLKDDQIEQYLPYGDGDIYRREPGCASVTVLLLLLLFDMISGVVALFKWSMPYTALFAVSVIITIFVAIKLYGKIR